jgi:hypothetical protein
MALTITQYPATASLAQSPIAFTVASSTPVTASQFQYVGDLYYWDGAVAASGSVKYTLVKFPNTSLVGIFDVGRIINSTLTDLAQANTSNVKYLKVDFYSQYYDTNGNYQTGSHTISPVFKALDGYGLFQEPIGQPISSKTTHWPIMTSGPATQSFFEDNRGQGAVYVGDVGVSIPTKIIYSGSNANGVVNVSGNTATSGQIAQFPLFPGQPGFPFSSVGLEYYTVQAYSGATALGTPIRYEIACQQKYPNVRIKWKNRFGQFDWFNFNMVSRTSFGVDRKNFQPQIGSWDGSSLSYNNYDSQNQTYISNAKQGLSVNTNFINQDYNDIIKQLLSSDEAYWVYDEANSLLRPITIDTNSIVFKTGVVDKTIQYAFDFVFGQEYKLLI